MRINPISIMHNRQNLRPQNQNISFGRFADDRARNIAYDYLEAEDDDCGKDAFNYLDETPFVTIKSAINKGKAFIYAVAERSAIDRHKNKNLFDKMMDISYSKYSIDAKFLNKNARDIGATGKPGFLTELEDFADTHNLYELFCDCEEGNYGQSGGSSSDSGIEYAEKTPYEQGYEDSFYMRR